MLVNLAFLTNKRWSNGWRVVAGDSLRLFGHELADVLILHRMLQPNPLRAVLGRGAPNQRVLELVFEVLMDVVADVLDRSARPQYHLHSAAEEQLCAKEVAGILASW